MLSLEWPWLLALLPLPLLVRWLVPATQHADTPLRVPLLDSWRQAAGAALGSATRNALAITLLVLVWLLLLLAAARPVWRGDPVTQQATGRDLMLAVDISGSMQFRDMVYQGQAVDRLTAVKGVVGDFVIRRQGDRLGLILFGSNAYLHVPLTFDGRTMQTLLGEAQIGFAGEQTAIGDAIAMAVKHLKDSDADSRVLVLLTDGADTASNIAPAQATELARQIRLKIYTIGVGAREMIQPGILGPRRVNPSAELNEPVLENIAASTDGQSFRAADPEQQAELYQLLDQLEPAEHDVAVFRPQVSLSYWPLAAAMLLTLMMALARAAGYIRGTA